MKAGVAFRSLAYGCETLEIGHFKLPVGGNAEVRAIVAEALERHGGALELMLQISEDRDAIFKTQRQYERDERDESYEGARVKARSEKRRYYATVNTVGGERKEDRFICKWREEKFCVGRKRGRHTRR